MSLLRTSLAAALCLLAVGSAHAEFSDDFSSPNVSALHWTVSGGGRASFEPHELILQALGRIGPHPDPGSFPLVQLNTNPFPSTEWSASFVFRYIRWGNYGDSILCPDKDGNMVIRVHCDRNGIVYTLGNNVVGRQTKSDTKWHAFSVCRSGSTMTAYLDQEKIGACTITAQPIGIQFGTTSSAQGLDWSDMEVARVSITSGMHVESITKDRQAVQDFIDDFNSTLAKSAPDCERANSFLAELPDDSKVQQDAENATERAIDTISSLNISEKLPNDDRIFFDHAIKYVIKHFNDDLESAKYLRDYKLALEPYGSIANVPIDSETFAILGKYLRESEQYNDLAGADLNAAQQSLNAASQTWGLGDVTVYHSASVATAD